MSSRFFGEIKQKLDEHDDKFEKNEQEHLEMRQDIFSIKQDVSGLKQDVSGLKQDVSIIKNDMLDGFDKVLKGLEDLKTENVANQGAHLRFDEKLDNHESRIKELELNTGDVS